VLLTRECQLPHETSPGNTARDVTEKGHLNYCLKFAIKIYNKQEYKIIPHWNNEEDGVIL
jgi:hypothetical protein